jgi:hypothetical protein
MFAEIAENKTIRLSSVLRITYMIYLKSLIVLITHEGNTLRFIFPSQW